MSRFLQVIIALMGLAITGVLGYASVRNESLQSKHALLSLFSESISVARTTCDPGMLFVAQDAVAGLEELGAGNQYRDRLEEISASIQACAATQGTTASSVAVAAPAPAPYARPDRGALEEAAPIAPDMAAQSSNLELRQAEIVQQKIAPAPSSETRNLTVLASYAVDDATTYDPERGAVAHYLKLREATKDANVKLEVYRTTVSNHFAIVLAPENGERRAAFKLLMEARRMGWSPDAFVQIDRDWKPCSDPSTIEGLKACK